MLRSVLLGVVLAGVLAGCSVDGMSGIANSGSGSSSSVVSQGSIGTDGLPSCTGGRVHLAARLFVRNGVVTDSYTVRPATTCVVRTTEGVPVRVTLSDEHGPVRFPTVNTKLASLAQPMWWTRGDGVGKRLDVTDTLSSGATVKLAAWCKLGGHTYTLTISAPDAKTATATRQIC